MTARVLLGWRRFAERAAEILAIEDRVVAEPVGSALLERDRSFASAFDEDLAAVGKHEREHDDERSTPIGHAFHRAQHLAVVRAIVAGLTGVARGANAR